MHLISVLAYVRQHFCKFLVLDLHVDDSIWLGKDKQKT
jgi:hypothetical protein